MNIRRMFTVIAGIFLSLSAFAELKYIEIETIKNAPIVQVKSIDDFESIIVKNKNSTVYQHKASDSLIVISENTYFLFIMNGYFTLEDFRNGNLLLFNTGSDYNEAKLLGVNDNSDIYYFYKRNDFKSIVDCRDAYKNGFCLSGKKKNLESDIYYKAKEYGFSNITEYNEYLDFTTKGFKSKNDMQTAIALGFPVTEEFLVENGELKNSTILYQMLNDDAGNDFYKSQELGFPNYAEYTVAKEKGILTFSDLQKYREITEYCEKLVEQQKLDRNFALMYYQISQLSETELSLSILSKILEENFNYYSDELKRALIKYKNTKKKETTNTSDSTKSTNRNLFQNGKKVYTIKKKPASTRNAIQETLFSTENLKKFFSIVNISEIGSYSEKTEIFKRKQ